MKFVKFLSTLLFSFLCITVVMGAQIDYQYKTELTIINDTDSNVLIQFFLPNASLAKEAIIYSHDKFALIENSVAFPEIPIKLSGANGMFFNRIVLNHTVLNVSDFMNIQYEK